MTIFRTTIFRRRAALLFGFAAGVRDAEELRKRPLDAIALAELEDRAELAASLAQARAIAFEAIKRCRNLETVRAELDARLERLGDFIAADPERFEAWRECVETESRG